MRLPGVEPGSIAWKAIILTVGLQTLDVIRELIILSKHNIEKNVYIDNIALWHFLHFVLEFYRAMIKL